MSKTIPLYNNEIEGVDLELIENGLTYHFKKEKIQFYQLNLIDSQER